ncbi:DUF1919 domain-containing protein [Paratractidigestivibacter sp.]|uniref:DUF1919 domain-containing protein n=2 Tax=Paratractidigestivibacter sp. TaxID=2847316 RepID=UPI002AC9658F|nr:DUF1919 domain-containing protein [Paratractidigestivibacter sp.]
MSDKGLRKKYRELLRAPINREMRSRLANGAPSILANNCNGGVIAHDLGLRFRTPTVNLYFPFPDYIRFLQRLDHYLSLPPEAMESIGGGSLNEKCPCGALEDIRMAFVHYPTFEAARDKWFERASRVDRSNLFVMLAQRDGCMEDDVRAFDELPFKHKVAFTAQPMPDCQSAVYIPGFADGNQVRVLSDYVSKFSGRRIIDEFDIVRFLNGSSY